MDIFKGVVLLRLIVSGMDTDNNDGTILQTKSSLEDKMSDYEDLWSPQYNEHSYAPRLSTFKPDLIPTSHVEYMDVTRRADSRALVDHDAPTFEHSNITSQYTDSRDGERQCSDKLCLSHSNIDQLMLCNNIDAQALGLYSEPIDSIPLRRNANRNSNPSIRWSQPTLLKLDYNCNMNGGDAAANITGNGQGKPSERSANISDSSSTNESLGEVHVGNKKRSLNNRSTCTNSERRYHLSSKKHMTSCRDERRNLTVGFHGTQTKGHVLGKMAASKRGHEMEHVLY